MNIFLWNLQILLAVMMLLPAFKIITLDRLTLIRNSGGRMDWVEELQPYSVKLVGGIKILMALGLLLPALINSKYWIIPFAALGVSGIMLLILSFHIKRKDKFERFVVNISIILLALFIAFTRLFILPI